MNGGFLNVHSQYLSTFIQLLVKTLLSRVYLTVGADGFLGLLVDVFKHVETDLEELA